MAFWFKFFINPRGPTGTGTETITSLYSSETADLQGTIQREPIALGGNSLSFEARTLQSVRPQTLATLFSPESGTPLQFKQLRQQRLDQINAALRTDGTPTQRQWLDRYAASQDQIQSLDEDLLGTFSAINSNDQDAQISATIALIQMQVSPVIQIEIAFGISTERVDTRINEGRVIQAALS